MSQQLVIDQVLEAPAYEIRFRPGNMCILAAALTMRSGRLVAPTRELNFGLFGAHEPWVPGTIPGLRVNTGRMHVFEVPGKLTTGSNLCDPWSPAEGAVISSMWATLDVAPEGQSVKFQFLKNGANWTAYRIPPTLLGATEEVVAGEIGIGGTKSSGYLYPEAFPTQPSLSNEAGVFVSGLQEGNCGGKEFRLNITQVGSGSTPGEGLRVYVPY